MQKTKEDEGYNSTKITYILDALSHINIVPLFRSRHIHVQVYKTEGPQPHSSNRPARAPSLQAARTFSAKVSIKGSPKPPVHGADGEHCVHPSWLSWVKVDSGVINGVL